MNILCQIRASAAERRDLQDFKDMYLKAKARMTLTVSYVPRLLDSVRGERVGRNQDDRPYLTESVYKVVLSKSIPARIRQRILYYYSYEGSVDQILRESTFATPLHKHFL